MTRTTISTKIPLEFWVHRPKSAIRLVEREKDLARMKLGGSPLKSSRSVGQLTRPSSSPSMRGSPSSMPRTPEHHRFPPDSPASAHTRSSTDLMEQANLPPGPRPKSATGAYLAPHKPALATRHTASSFNHGKAPGGPRRDWELSNGEKKWMMDLRNRTWGELNMGSKPQEVPQLGSIKPTTSTTILATYMPQKPTSPPLSKDSRLHRTTAASQMQTHMYWATNLKKDVPYANSLERWQNGLRNDAPEIFHPYSDFSLLQDLRKKQADADARREAERGETPPSRAGRGTGSRPVSRSTAGTPAEAARLKTTTAALKTKTKEVQMLLNHYESVVADALGERARKDAYKAARKKAPPEVHSYSGLFGD